MTTLPRQRATTAPHLLAPGLLWLAVGALVGWGLLGILTIGIVLLAAAVALAAVGIAWARTRNASVAAILVGAAAAPLTLAWWNRAGPGETCTSSGTTTSCTELLSPWPFAAVAAVLAVAGLALLGWAGRRHSR